MVGLSHEDVCPSLRAFLPNSMRHITLAFRTLRKTPFITAIAIASLALGIGANAAIYSMFDQMLLSALPIPDPDRLVNLSAPGPKPGSQSCGQAGNCEDVFSYPMFRDLEEKQQVFTGVAAHVTFGANLGINNEPMAARGMFVSGSYFPTLQARPAAGRLLTPEDDQAIGQHFVVVISHDLWMERFGGSPSAINQTIVINGSPYTIVGVTPREFFGTTMGVRPHVYVPITMRGQVLNANINFENRRSYFLYLFARLKPGVTMEQAQTAINAIYSPIINDVEAPLQQGMSETTMASFRQKRITVAEGYRGQSSMHVEARTPLLVLFATTGLVLLIACANIANLLLARGASRATEMGVRLALGASRRHLLAQLLTESVVLALLGGIASILVAKWTLNGIAALLPPEATEALEFRLEPGMFVFAGVLSLATGFIFGLFPAMHSTRRDLISAIRAGAGQIAGGGRSASRFRTSLATAQIALAMALLTSAIFFVKSLDQVSKVDLGLNVDSLVTFNISPIRSGYDTTRSAVLFNRVEEELASLPGVIGVTSSMVPLLAGSNWGTNVRVQGFECGPDTDCNSRYNEVSGDYFTTLGATFIDGRDISDSDRPGAARVAIVNEAFAKKFNMGDQVVGKYIGVGGNDSLNTLVIGYIRDAKYSDVKDSVPALFYTPWRQDTRVGTMNFYVKTSQNPDLLLRAIPEVMKRLDPMLPVEDLRTMPQQVKQNIFLDRMISIMSVSFALLATLLASIGLYGVLAYSVAQRTREIGVRMALGADSGRVKGLVLRQMARMVVVGGVIGIFAAFGIGRLGQSLLYGVEGHDPLVFSLAVLLLTLIAMAAGYLPARRAAKVDPMNALRYD